jgi:undecaprenyl-diphosphatase
MLKSRTETLRWISERLTVVSAVWLTAALAFSAFVIWAFFKLADEVLEGDSRAFDKAVLLWIHRNVPDWLDGPMRLVTALGYYYVVVPLLVVAVFLFYRRGWRLSAVLLAISTGGSIVLTTVLKGVFQRARPELFDSGYQASF